MTQLYLLSAVVTLYGLANGLIQVTTPQAALYLGLSSQDLGATAAGMPFGYALGCLVLGRVTRGISAKWVLLSGVLISLAAFLVMAILKSKTGCMVSMAMFGLAGGAFWPFASAWMLDFQSLEIPKSRILKFYNLGWTSGTASGLFLGGLLCKQGYYFETIWCGAALIIVVLVLALIPKATHHAASPSSETIALQARKVTLAALLAAVSCNMLALATRAIVLNNYAELNELYDKKGDVIGRYIAASVFCQLLTFFFSSKYEKYLGFKRTYFILAALLVTANLCFAYVKEEGVLLLCAAVLGIVLAVAFQACIFASTGFFHSARSGTTFHEAMVGVGQTYTLFAGVLIEQGKHAHWSSLDALRLPFIVLASLVTLAFCFQQGALSWGKGRQALASH